MKIILSKYMLHIALFFWAVFLSLTIVYANEASFWKKRANEYKLDTLYYELKIQSKQQRIDTLTTFIVNYEKQDYLKHQQ